MRAAVLLEKELIRVEEISERALLPGEVRVKIEAALTCGTDLKVYKRGYHAKMIVPPAVFGHELAGTISEVHPETRGWQLGERVVPANSAPCGVCFFCQRQQENLCQDLLFLNGAYAESIIIPSRIVEKNLLRLLPETRFPDAALTEPLACVVQGIEDTHLGGERVLVIGAGPIGLMFAVLARAAGCNVTIAGRGPARLELARRLAAADTIDVSGRTLDPSQIDGLGFDVVIEAVGKAETWEQSVNLVRKGGRVNFFGGCPPGTMIKLDADRIHYSNLRLLASFHHTPRTVRKAQQLIEQGIIRAADFVTGHAKLSELPALFASMAAGDRAVKTLVDVRA